MPSGRFVLRATVGTLMVGHGLQKLRGSFGGAGLEGTEKSMESIGLYPPRHQALAAGLAETIGGGLTAAGLLSPLGPSMVIGVMAVAITKVHAKNGVWAHSGGYEYNLTLIASCLSLATSGPGPLSIDGLFRKQRSGLRWGALSLLLGLGGAAATFAVSDRMAPSSSPDFGGVEDAPTDDRDDRRGVRGSR